MDLIPIALIALVAAYYTWNSAAEWVRALRNRWTQ